jgi:hypothetical protein
MTATITRNTKEMMNAIIRNQNKVATFARSFLFLNTDLILFSAFSLASDEVFLIV